VISENEHKAITRYEISVSHHNFFPEALLDAARTGFYGPCFRVWVGRLGTGKNEIALRLDKQPNKQ